MTITESQRITIMKLWQRVCKDRGWKASDKARRIATFSELIGRQITSTNEVGRLDECTKLMAELKVMLGTSLKAGLEANDPTLNQARVIAHQICADLIPCLELYEGANTLEFVTGIMEDKNRWWRIDHAPTRRITIQDLNARPIVITDRRTGKLREIPSPLHQMQMTIAARVDAKRRAAGQSVHEMRVAAGVPCHCKLCGGVRVPDLAPLPPAVLPANQSPEPKAEPLPF